MAGNTAEALALSTAGCKSVGDLAWPGGPPGGASTLQDGGPQKSSTCQSLATPHLATQRKRCTMDLGSGDKGLLISQREEQQTLSLSARETPPQGWSYVSAKLNLNPASSSKCQPKETREGSRPRAPEPQQQGSGGESCEANDLVSSANGLRGKREMGREEVRRERERGERERGERRERTQRDTQGADEPAEKEGGTEGAESWGG